MKIFLDTADTAAIAKCVETGLVDGVTTNPSIVMKTGKKFRPLVEEICKICPGAISAEAVAPTAEGMIKEAVELSKIAPNVVVKIPMSIEGLKAIPVLEKEKGVKINLTMVFSATQTFLGFKSGPTYLSIVLSRLDAIANESDILVNDAVTIKQNYGYPTEIIAGSLKTQNHVLSCLRAGIDIVTIPPELFWQMYKHLLTDQALEQFDKDWAKVPK
jgi:transaldolase